MPARPATLTVRFQKISVASTRRDLQSHPAILLWGIYVREQNPPPDAKPIEWLLLTTEEVGTAPQATAMVDYYSRRWRIEEWHRILKSGCRVEEHQHQTGERLKRAIAMDVVLAWRIQLLVLLGRQTPELPCDIFFDNWEVKVLEALQQQKSQATRGKAGKEGKAGKGKRRLLQHEVSVPLLLQEAVTLVAQLGGYLARGSDPPPGAECLWKGMSRLSGMAAGYRLALALADTRAASP